jgi:hypothetical protein
MLCGLVTFPHMECNAIEGIFFGIVENLIEKLFCQSLPAKRFIEAQIIDI